MDDITVNMAIEKWSGKWDISDGEDIDYTADTLAEALLYFAKMLEQKSHAYRAMALTELQTRINKLD